MSAIRGPGTGIPRERMRRAWTVTARGWNRAPGLYFSGDDRDRSTRKSTMIPSRHPTSAMTGLPTETRLMGTKITAVDVHDVRFPTAATADGSDAINRGDYSATYGSCAPMAAPPAPA